MTLSPLASVRRRRRCSMPTSQIGKQPPTVPPSPPAAGEGLPGGLFLPMSLRILEACLAGGYHTFIPPEHVKVPGMTEVTRILSALEQGDAQAAELLLPLVYDELRQLAAQERRVGKECRPRVALR